MIDEVKLYNRGLTEAEVLQNFQERVEALDSGTGVLEAWIYPPLQNTKPQFFCENSIESMEGTFSVKPNGKLAVKWGKIKSSN